MMLDWLTTQFDIVEPQLRARLRQIAADDEHQIDKCFGPVELAAETFDHLTTETGEVFDVAQMQTIQFGDYRGTIIFVVPSGDYYVIGTSYGYGSCTGCDALQMIGLDIDALIGEARTMVQHAVELV